MNALAPGWIKTAWGETASSAWQDRVLRETPLESLGNARGRRPASPASWSAPRPDS